MELWKQLEIVRNEKRNWLFGKDNTEERINALNNIIEIGQPGAIAYLIPSLKDNNIEIRNLTCKAIVRLFAKVSSKKSFYETVKYADISTSDIGFYRDNFTDNEYQTLLAVASLNSSGYTREQAVYKLVATQSPFAIQFIIYRLADWVQNVREAAIQALQYFKNVAFINALVENIETLEWLQSVERTDLSSYYANLMDFIVVQNKDHVIKNFKIYSDKTRIIIARQLTQTEKIDLKDIQILLSDKHFIVRNVIVNVFHKLTESHISQLLSDKSARIRYETLYKLKNAFGFENTVLGFVADCSATVRGFARYSLKHKVADFSTIYHQNLLNNQHIIGSLMGIAETNGKQYTEAILPFLKHRSIQVRKRAFLALKKMDENQAYDFALSNLDTDLLGLRNLLITYLATKTTSEVLGKSRSIYENGNYELKKSMLKLFSKIGKWATIADLMIGTIDEDENIRNQSVQYVNLWKNKATSYFTQPKPGELERANQIFNLAYELHQANNYFPQNPLSGIDFYLK